MRLIWKILLLLILLAAVAIQFFQPEKNNGGIAGNHIFQQEKLPENIRLTLQNACMDCHSNQTNYLWYHHLAPVSWMIDRHVDDGKDELNFSDWGKMDVYDKIGALEDICQEIERKTMPLKSYLIMHGDARLSDEEVSAICAWSKKLSQGLTEKLNKQE